MSSTAPPGQLNSRHGVLAAWLAAASLPRRSTLPPRHRSHHPRRTSPPAPLVTTRAARHHPRRTSPPAPHVTAQRRRASARATPALGGTCARRPKAEHAGRTMPHLAGGN
ncbi:MAG TPA: hypothetical protein VFV94_08070 [Polyangiaceae bacterium]|nr:hypothetical protein [Polyangiaceae bacterium]